MFKSYYVVWKQINNQPIDFLFSLFKSYYVVWKPLPWRYLYSAYCVFKSYYVVWKRYIDSFEAQDIFCLNRTM